MSPYCDALPSADVSALTSRVLGYPLSHQDPPSAPSASPGGVEPTHKAGIQRTRNTPLRNSPISCGGSSQSQVFIPPCTATSQETKAAHRISHRQASPQPLLQPVALLQFNVVLQHSQAPVTVPASIAPIGQSAIEAFHCKSFLDTATQSACAAEGAQPAREEEVCKQAAAEPPQPAREEEVCKQAAGCKTGFTKPPGSTQTLRLEDLQRMQPRQHEHLQLDPRATALVTPDYCQLDAAELKEMQQQAPTISTLILRDLNNSALAMPESGVHRDVDASCAAGNMQHRQPQTGIAAEHSLVDADEQPNSSGTTQQQQQQQEQRHILVVEQDTMELPALALAAQATPEPSHSCTDSERPQLQVADLDMYGAQLLSQNSTERSGAHMSLDSELCLSSQHCHAHDEHDEEDFGEEGQVTGVVSFQNSLQMHAMVQPESGAEAADGRMLVEVCLCLVGHPMFYTFYYIPSAHRILVLLN